MAANHIGLLFPWEKCCFISDGNKLCVYQLVGTPSAECCSKWLLPHKDDSGLIIEHKDLLQSPSTSSCNACKTRRSCLVSPTQLWWVSGNTVY
jgi:hypothetical protein